MPEEHQVYDETVSDRTATGEHYFQRPFPSRPKGNDSGERIVNDLLLRVWLLSKIAWKIHSSLVAST